MSDRFSSFYSSPLGAFVESPLRARGGPLIVYRLSRCGTADVIYTGDDLTAHLGNVVLLADGYCYGVTVDDGAPIQSVSVTSGHASCADCGAGPGGDACAPCVPGTMPTTGEMELVVTGVQWCACAKTSTGDMAVIAGSPNGTFSLDFIGGAYDCHLKYESPDYPIIVRGYTTTNGTCGGLTTDCAYRLQWAVTFLAQGAAEPTLLRVQGFLLDGDPDGDPEVCKVGEGGSPITGSPAYFFHAELELDTDEDGEADCGADVEDLANAYVLADCQDGGLELGTDIGYGGTVTLRRA